MQRLVLIDGNAIMHRAYHALPPLTTKDGKLVNAVYGFTSMLLKVINDLKPTHLAVTFDRPEPTFRQEMFKDYQAQRPAMADELGNQFVIVKEVLETMGIAVFELAGYEADDVIGSIAKQVLSKWEVRGEKLDKEMGSEKSGFQDISLQHPASHSTHRTSKPEVIIVTGDRDMLQLVNDSIKLYVPIKGLTEAKIYDAAAVKEKFAIAPEQIVDYKALIGDPSDNYPGVAGVGPKTAASLLAEYKSLAGIYQHINGIKKDALKEQLKAGEKNAEMAKKLATIVVDAPVEIDIDRCILPTLVTSEVEKLFQTLQFRSLIPRLKGEEVKPEITQRKQEKKEDNQLSLLS